MMRIPIACLLAVTLMGPTLPTRALAAKDRKSCLNVCLEAIAYCNQACDKIAKADVANKHCKKGCKKAKEKCEAKCKKKYP